MVHLTNSSQSELKIESITVSGTDSGDFAETNDCGPVLPAGKSCAVRIRFTPRESGERRAVIRIVDDGEANPHEVGVNGIGAAPRTGAKYPPKAPGN